MKSSNKISAHCLALMVVFLGQSSIYGQVYVGDAGGGDGFVNTYTFSGQSIETPLLYTPNGVQEGITVSGNVLYIADYYHGTIGEYNATSGAVINSSYIAASQGSYGVAVGNGFVYVSNQYGMLTAYEQLAPSTTAWSLSGLGAGTTGDVVVSGTNVFLVHSPSGSDDSGSEISEYNALTGAVENSTLVTGLVDTYGLAISGNDLFVSSYGGGTIGEYTTAGATIDASLVTGIPDGADGLAVADNTIYVSDIFRVEMYSVSNGDLIGTISGLEEADSVAVVPEPSTWALLLGGLGLLAFWRMQRMVS
jgi:hypothetical protein